MFLFFFVFFFVFFARCSVVVQSLFSVGLNND